VLVDVNPALCDLFGRPADVLLKARLADLFHPEDVALVRELAPQSGVEAQTSSRLEVRCVRADGALLWAELSTSHVVAGEDSREIWMVAHVQDVDARHRSDERVRRTDARNAALADELQERNSELRDTNLRLRQFASLASHDLSAPLASVSGVLASIDRRVGAGLEPDDRELLSAARGRAEQMRGLIEDMLAYARTGETLRVTEVDVGELVRGALVDLTVEVAARNPQIDIGPMPTLRADRGQLLRVLRNLLQNALKFGDADERPVIHVDAQRRDHGWEIAVADNGRGVEPADRSRIFDMLERAHPRHAAGSGLGLAICADVVRRHGGEIWMQPAPPHGSRFAFTLPDLMPSVADAQRESR
jgi:PAS domain S-box-containing protein